MRTFGTVALSKDGATWFIDCEPQVALRLKRLFAKVARSTKGILTLSDTPENGRELAWFLLRYPMLMSDRDRDHLVARETQYKILAADVGRILSGDYTPRGYDLALPLREYQRIAADLALRTGGLLVGDDVGLGKTATAIGVLSDPSCRPALVVTLTHLPRQWQAELQRFLPGVRTHVLKKGTPYPIERPRTLVDPGGLPDVILSNYHKLSGWAGELAGKIRCVVFDEVQELRHARSQQGPTAKYVAAKQIADAAHVKLGLSATPVFNYAGEIHNIVEVLRPGALGTKAEFKTEWCGDSYGDKEIVKDPKALGSFMRESGLMLRRTRSDVGRELPALTVVPHLIEADLDEINKVASSAADLARIILRQGGMGIDKLKAAEELSWRLRQATGIGKAPFAAEFVNLLVESGERVLVYAWHREVYSLLEDKLKHLRPAFFTGEESPAQKDEAKRRFVEGDAKALIMSLRAGAGLDGLQGVCRTVVFAELDWSPAVHEQAIGRVHRDGQKDPVVAYYLVADSGSDPIVSDVLGLKRAQLDGVRDPNAELVTRSQSDPDRIKRLAQDFLRQRGIQATEAA